MMNNQLQEFARSELKIGLSQCTDRQQLLFKQMYSHDNLSTTIDDVVDKLPVEKLDWAMQQVEQTMK